MAKNQGSLLVFRSKNALEQAVYPVIQECVHGYTALTFATDIAEFRRRALALAETVLEEQFVRVQLHQPTLRLRQGNHTAVVNGDATFLEDLAHQLAIRRQHSTSTVK